jgi:hypothetical protein
MQGWYGWLLAGWKRPRGGTTAGKSLLHCPPSAGKILALHLLLFLARCCLLTGSQARQWFLPEFWAMSSASLMPNLAATEVVVSPSCTVYTWQ